MYQRQAKSDEWATPTELYKELNAEFHFNLDPCATPENAKCAKFYTKEENGLAQSWGGYRVFVNPPYSDITPWVKKAAEESAEGTLVVMLLPARTDTRWFHQYVYHKAAIRFLKGRLHFGDGKGTAPFPSMICIYAEDPNE